MILFTIVLFTLLAGALVALISALVAGAGFLVVFGDLAVFAVLVWLIVKLFTRKKK